MPQEKVARLDQDGDGTIARTEARAVHKQAAWQRHADRKADASEKPEARTRDRHVDKEGRHQVSGRSEGSTRDKQVDNEGRPQAHRGLAFGANRPNSEARSRA